MMFGTDYYGHTLVHESRHRDLLRRAEHNRLADLARQGSPTTRRISFGSLLVWLRVWRTVIPQGRVSVQPTFAAQCDGQSPNPA